MNVNELMTPDVQTCAPSASLLETARAMEQHDCGSLPVVEEDTQVVLGMITDRDICLAAADFDQRLSELYVGDAMSRGTLRTCSPEDTVQRVEAKMQRFQIRRIPVVDSQGRVVGILSQNDILRAARREACDVSPEEATQMLAGIGERPLTEER